MSKEIELWEQEIEIENKYQESIKEDTIYDFTDSEPVQEGIITSVLASIGLYATACACLLAAAIVGSEKRRKANKEDLDKNPKSKALINKALDNLQDFVYKNLPSDIKKYAEKRPNIEIDEHSKLGKTIRQYDIISFDIDKLVTDLIDSKYKNVEDLIIDDLADKKMEDETNDQFRNRIVENLDTVVDTMYDTKFYKYRKFINRIHKFTSELNKKMNKIHTSYKVNVQLYFEDMDGGIAIDQCPYFSIRFDIPDKKTIGSFTLDELQDIEKITKVKLPTNESVEFIEEGFFDKFKKKKSTNNKVQSKKVEKYTPEEIKVLNKLCDDIIKFSNTKFNSYIKNSKFRKDVLDYMKECDLEEADLPKRLVFENFDGDIATGYFVMRIMDPSTGFVEQDVNIALNNIFKAIIEDIKSNPKFNKIANFNIDIGDGDEGCLYMGITLKKEESANESVYNF